MYIYIYIICFIINIACNIPFWALRYYKNDMNNTERIESYKSPRLQLNIVATCHMKG